MELQIGMMVKMLRQLRMQLTFHTTNNSADFVQTAQDEALECYMPTQCSEDLRDMLNQVVNGKLRLLDLGRKCPSFTQDGQSSLVPCIVKFDHRQPQPVITLTVE